MGERGANGPEPGSRLTPGTIGVLSGELARFTDFSVSLAYLERPPGTKLRWVKGMDVTANYNAMTRDLHGDWLWIMGDDHVFEPDLLLRLLAHGVDVVVPICMTHTAPYEPVVYGSESQDVDGTTYFHEAELPGEGLVEVHAAGSAGMLIRRRVLEAIEPPHFATSGTIQNEDLNFCQKVRDAGFKIHCDLDARLGHIGIVAVWPLWQGVLWGAALNMGNGHVTPLLRMPADRSD